MKHHSTTVLSTNYLVSNVFICTLAATHNSSTSLKLMNHPKKYYEKYRSYMWVILWCVQPSGLSFSASETSLIVWRSGFPLGPMWQNSEPHGQWVKVAKWECAISRWLMSRLCLHSCMCFCKSTLLQPCTFVSVPFSKHALSKSASEPCTQVLPLCSFSALGGAWAQG